MKKNKYAFLTLASLFLLLSAGGLVFANRSEERMNTLPAVRVAIGMSVKDLRRGSTYAFESDPARNEEKDTNVFGIYQPYNLVYVDDGKELKLENIGEKFFLTAIMVRNGKVDNISVTPQHEKLPLVEAMAKAEYLFAWFKDAGFEASATGKFFYITQQNGESMSVPISSFQEAQSSLLNSKAKIEQIHLFSLRKGEVGMSLILTNARRQRARFNKKLDDETHVTEEREYYLDMFVTKRE